jgi:hypothetical protein
MTILVIVLALIVEVVLSLLPVWQRKKVLAARRRWFKGYRKIIIRGAA